MFVLLRVISIRYGGSKAYLLSKEIKSIAFKIKRLNLTHCSIFSSHRRFLYLIDIIWIQ